MEVREAAGAVAGHMSVDIQQVCKSLETALTMPSRFSAEANQIVYEPVADAIVLSCGHLVSETLYGQLAKLGEAAAITCPVCFEREVTNLNVVQQLRDLHAEYLRLKEAGQWEQDVVVDELKKSRQQRRRSSSKKTTRQDAAQKMSLLTAFHEIVTDLNKPSAKGSFASTSPASPSAMQHQIHDTSPHESNVGDWIATMNDSTTLRSFKSSRSSEINLGTSPTATRAPITSSNLTNAIRTTTNVISTAKDDATSLTDKELIYAKNFPFFRKQIQHSTRTSKFSLKGRYSKLFINSDFSPNLSKFVLLSEKKFEVHSMDPAQPTKAPKLLCVGKSTGEYGENMESLQKPSLASLLANSNCSTEEGKTIDDALSDKLLNWEHLYCKLSDNFLVVAGTRGILRIFNLNQNGKAIYTYISKFPIRCVDISGDERFISIGITGKDKYTQAEQALIVLLKLEFLNLQGVENSVHHDALFAYHTNTSTISNGTDSARIQPQSTSEDFKFKVEPITITLPYRDPINILKFSPSSLYLSCSTALESRFVIISIENPDEPKLIMKSLRSIDTSLESEGITDLTFFPDNRWMVITSVAFNASPIIIDTRITSINSIQGIAQPLMLLRVDEVGSSIHKAAVSPRGDAVAFLDRNGVVYLMSSPHMDDNENKRIVVVAEVTNAYRVREAATMRFDKDGYKLFILDRKGVLYVEDFTAGTSQSHDITRCKLIC